MDKNRNLAESEVIKKNQTNSGAEVINRINENAKESLCHRADHMEDEISNLEGNKFEITQSG